MFKCPKSFSAKINTVNKETVSGLLHLPGDLCERVLEAVLSHEALLIGEIELFVAL